MTIVRTKVFHPKPCLTLQDLHRQLKDVVVAEGLVDFKFVIEVGGKSLCAIIRTLSDTQIAT
jgi:hypothetical protein